jgi:hypothetical protein
VENKMNITMIKGVVTRGVGRGILIGRKYSPQILLGIGIVSGITSTVLACKATLKADEVLDEARDQIARVKTAHATVPAERYSEMDYRKDMTVVYRDAAVGFAKLYWPAITLGGVSIACVLGAHGIMSRRNVALVAAYKAVEKSFADYRKRVVDRFGEEVERDIKLGIQRDSYTEITFDADGNEIKSETNDIPIIDPNGISQYAKIFDSTNKNWDPTNSYNMLFLTNHQRIANDILHSRGHLFLNEVYEMLGFEHTPAGAVVGWVNGMGDDFVDFGIFDTTVSGYIDDKANDTIGEQRRDFINSRGYKNAILLDFNVAGTMYDKI